MSLPSRRAFIGRSLAASAALTLAPSAALASMTARRRGAASATPWLEAARKADRWLRSTAVRDDRGMRWPVDPTNPSTVQVDLYSGMAGVVLFYLEFHHAGQDPAHLAMAQGGADYLLATLPDESEAAEAGLYTGLAGTAVVLQHAWRATNDPRYREGVHRILRRLQSSATPTGKGVEWNVSTDIISGSAGIGLSLLALADAAPGDVDTRRLAARIGDRLVERAQSTGDGLTWLVQPGMPRNYPNFSHGTAGVSFFLARNAQVQQRPSDLEAALAGERWLRSIMTGTPGGGRMIYHSTPGNEALYYLSWCHGPAGTARLYHALAGAAGDPSYAETVRRLATAIVDMKVPKRSPGFWNNISECCGNCGVSDFFVSLHRMTGDATHLAFAEDVAHDTLARATSDGDGYKWIQAENRVQPDVVVAQTGLMQGAAGVGLSMLRLDGARQGRPPFVRLPDEAF